MQPGGWNVQNAKPFLKWAGGKQQLLDQFEPFFPNEIHRYFEPFLGGGAVYFRLWNTGRLAGTACLADTNAEVINAYRAVRDNVDELIGLLTCHERQHSREYYYRIRALDRSHTAQTQVEQAARTIYLNRTCYNGLYRVNRSGHFNVPMGSYREPKIVHEETLRAASRALQNAHLAVRNFEAILDHAQPGDFIYFDPPYDPVSKTASFTSYTSGSFGDEDQRRLAQVFAALSARGCYCMLSNSYTPFILNLYQDFKVETVQAIRAINSNGSARGQIAEVVVLNILGCRPACIRGCSLPAFIP